MSTSVSVVTSMIAKRISAIKDFANAKKAADSILASGTISAEDKAAVEEAIAQHKGNPDRQTELQAEGTIVANADGTDAEAKLGPVDRAWEVAIGGISKEEIKRRLALPEENPEHIDFDKAMELSANSGGFKMSCSKKTAVLIFKFPTQQKPVCIHEGLALSLLNNAATVIAAINENHATTAAVKAKVKAAK
jgi:hypothetical protein